jgi:transposase-like protein
MVKNLKELFKKFSNEDRCREFLIQQRWNGQPECPYCGHTKVYTIEGGKRFKCANQTCYKKFSVTVGTVFEASNIPLSTWFPAMYIIASHKKGISSVQLAKDLGVTQKTAWFMLHRIRESLKEDHPTLLSGIVESDETYMGRKYRSDFKGTTQSEEQVDYQLKNTIKGKGGVLGLAERGTGKIKVFAFPEIKSPNVKKAIYDNVQPGSEIHTDESFLYRRGLDEYIHKSIRHADRQWSVNGVHTNNVECFWSVMKRGVYGIYHQISYKHLQAYCNEFSYRFNTRKMTDGQRFSVVLQGLEGRLTYKQLVHGKDSQKDSQENPETKGE